MRLLDYAAEALEALWANRMRSLLTMLGMVIGIASVIGVLVTAGGASSALQHTIATFGDGGVTVSPDPQQDRPELAQLHARDAAAIAARAGGLVVHVVPEFVGFYQASYGGARTVAPIASSGAYQTGEAGMAEGRRIDARDVEVAAHVIVLSSTLKRQLFGDRPAVGAVVRINGMPLQVVGVFGGTHASFTSTLGAEQSTVIPYSLFPALRGSEIADDIQFYPVPRDDDPAAEAAVTRILQRLHGAQARYRYRDANQQNAVFGLTLDVISAGLTAVGGIALLVAAVGIMNIMLVAVVERTREIGIRRAVGASRREIVAQFLAEAVMLSLAGGVVGTAIGVLFGWLVVTFVVVSAFGEASVPWMPICLVSAGTSVLVGVLAGVYPALRAARLEPSAALRG